MHDKPQDKPAREVVGRVNPLKSLSAAEFAQLGGEHLIYVRKVRGEDLARLLPNAVIHDDDAELFLAMSAAGEPVLVTDTYGAVLEWLEDKPVGLATVN